MEREDVNELILQKVNEIDDDQVRNFVEDVLRFERAEQINNSHITRMISAIISSDISMTGKTTNLTTNVST